MFLRIITFMIGIILNIIGVVSIIIYLNILINGYTFLEYVNFIIRRFECWLLLVGILVIYLSIFIKGEKDEIHLRHNIKF